MSRWEQTGERSLAFSQWHREKFSDDADAFDVDLMGICHQLVDAFPDEKMNLVQATIGTLVYAEMRFEAENTTRKMNWEDERERLKALLREAA